MNTKPLTIGTLRNFLKAMKYDTRLFLHGDAKFDRPSWSDEYVFTLTRVDKKPGDIEIKSTIEIPGIVRNGTTSHLTTHQSMSGKPFEEYTEPYRPLRGYWSLYACDTFVNLIKTLSPRAEVTLEISLDGGTNGYLKKNGLHTDYLYLATTTRVDKSDRTIKRLYLMDSETGEHNTARFGNPQHERDTQGKAA